jgi:hypothetical protein
MSVYTVHEPPRDDRRDDELAHTARFVFVRDGFHFWAFLFGPLWMLRHRMWLETIVYLILVGALTYGLSRLGIERTAFWIAFLISLLVGLEASSLRRWKLSRRRFTNLGVVAADNLEDAERRFFDGYVADERPVPRVPASPPTMRPASAASSNDIIGLFPQPGARS